MVVLRGRLSLEIGWRCVGNGLFVRVCCGVFGGVVCQVCVLIDILPMCVCAVDSCGRLLWVCLGVCLLDGSLVGVRCGVADVRVLGCDFLGLLSAFGFSVMYVFFCVFGGFVLPLVSFAIIGSWVIRGRLRFL